MPRPPCILLAGDTYHIVTRGDCRRAMFHKAGRYECFTDRVRQVIEGSGWIECEASQRRFLKRYGNWLLRNETGATHGQFGPAFGPNCTDSVYNLVRRAQQPLKGSASGTRRQRDQNTAQPQYRTQEPPQALPLCDITAFDLFRDFRGELLSYAKKRCCCK
jgi:hypothetical protein